MDTSKGRIEPDEATNAQAMQEARNAEEDWQREQERLRDEAVSKAAAAMGRAGRGVSKVRGDSDHYRALVAKRADRGCSRCHQPIEPGQGFCLYREPGGREAKGIKYNVHAECIAEDATAGRLVRVSRFAFEPVA